MKFIKDKIYRWHHSSYILLIRASENIDSSINRKVPYNAHLWLTTYNGNFNQTTTNEPILWKELTDDVTIEESAYMNYCIVNKVDRLTLEEYKKIIKTNIIYYEIY